MLKNTNLFGFLKKLYTEKDYVCKIVKWRIVKKRLGSMENGTIATI
jgi:hypothetical protein